MFFKKKKIDEWEVGLILHNFLVEHHIKSDIYITFEISKRGIVSIKTNKPGLLIGKQGVDIERIRNEMKEKANVKDVKIYEMRHFVMCDTVYDTHFVTCDTVYVTY